jgi:predicted dehydrogenase
MTSEELGFAVVGLGMGQAHCADIVDAQGARLVAVCDIDAARLQAMVDQYGVRGYERLEDVLADPEVDVVNVATPSGMHADMTVAALRAGKHVICEKPPDVTVEKVDQMIAAARETGQKLQIIFQSRFHPLYQRVREAVQSGRLGPLAGVHGAVHWYRAQSYYDGQGGWRGTWQWDGGGSLANQGVHTVDLIQWIAGPVESVFGRIGVFGHQIDTEDKTAAVLKFRSGAIGTLTTTTCAYPGLTTELIFHGMKGSIVCLDGALHTWRIQGENEQEEERTMLAMYGPSEARDVSVASDPMALNWRGHLLQVEDMVQAIREDRDPFITAESARSTLAIVCALYQSAREGREVAVP